MNLKSFLTGTTNAAILLSAALLTPGCGTPTQRDLMREDANTGERPVAMKGETTLFAGMIGAVATVSRGFERGAGPGGRAGKLREGDALEEPGGRRRNKDDSGLTEVYNVGGFGDSEEEQKEAMAEYMRMARARRAQGSPMPPVTLRVAIENRGTTPVELEVTDVVSDLGNFAVRPAKLTIAAGEKGALEPMISQLGVTSDDIPVKIVVRMAGKKETQVIAVKNIILPQVRK